MQREEEQDKAKGTGEGQIATTVKKMRLLARPQGTTQEF